MRHLNFLAGCSLFAAGAALSQPVPPVAPPPPQPGQAQPMTQEKPKDIAAAPGTAGAKPAKWDVNARHGPGHDAQIDTRTGTWLSLDVSPDGREIAFDLLGDLYVIPIEGGEARTLTSGNAWDMQPRYSPNGQEIAFTSDRGGGDNVWTIRRDGLSPRQITKEDFRLLNQADWSPDGNFIVARKHFTSARSLGSGEMWLYHRSGADKGGGVQMTKARTKQKDTNEPAFSPDGRYLYFSDDATPGDTFQYSIGAFVAGFTRPPDNSSDYGLRRLADDLGADRAGPVILHEPGDDPTLSELADCYRFVASPEPATPPASHHLMLYAQPSQIAGLSSADQPFESALANESPAVQRQFERDDPPVWVVAAQRYIEGQQAELLRFEQAKQSRATTPAESAHYAGLASGLEKIRGVVERHAEGLR